MAAIAADGYPVTLEDLNNWYPTPEGENAADTYALAFKAFASVPELEKQLPYFGGNIILPPRGQPFDTPTVERIEKYLELNAKAISLVREATQIKKCRFPVDMRLGTSALLPHLGSIRQVTQLLTLSVRLNLQRDQLDLAMDDLSVIFRMADSLKNEPILISYLVLIAVHQNGVTNMQQILHERDLSDQQLNRLDQLLIIKTPYRGLARAYVGERCVWIDIMKRPEFLDDDPKSKGLTLSLVNTSGILIPYRLVYLRKTREMIRGVTTVTGSQVPVPPDTKDIPRYAILTRIGFPAYDAFVFAVLHHLDRIDCARVGLALKRYKKAHKQWPDRLEQLIPDYLDAIPTDRFTRQPLHYQVRGQGAIVWAPGKDGQDNHGAIFSAKGLRYSAGTDITFSLDLPEEEPPNTHNNGDKP